MNFEFSGEQHVERVEAKLKVLSPGDPAGCGYADRLEAGTVVPGREYTGGGVRGTAWGTAWVDDPICPMVLFSTRGA